MTFQLTDGVSFANVDDATIVLDLKRDRYLRLGHDAQQALNDLAAGQRKTGNSPGLSTLLNAGILCDGCARPIIPVSVARPDCSALEVPRRPSSFPGVLAVGLTNLRVRRWLAREGLAATVGRLRRDHGSGRSNEDEDRAIAISQRYASARRLLPGVRPCIPESFSLSMFLTRSHIVHTVVFGVSLSPFAAHAWVQTESHVLSDRADRIRAFHPVFIL